MIRKDYTTGVIFIIIAILAIIISISLNILVDVMSQTGLSDLIR